MTRLSDEGVFSISKILYSEFLSEKRLKQLDIDKIDQFKRLYIKPLYPHKQVIYNGVPSIQKYDCCEYCCELSPGRFCCCDSTTPDPPYKQFGLGVCLYTKFMKHLAIFMFFISILAIISIAAYELVSIQSGYPVTNSYHNALFSTTMGIISSQYLKCGYSAISANNSASFTLSCPAGEVVLSQPVFTNYTLETISNCRKQDTKINARLYLPDYTQTLQNTSLASIQVSTTLASNSYEGINYQYLAYKYQCINQKYALSGTTALNTPMVVYLTVAVDLVIITCFLFFLISENKAEQNEVNNFKKRELAVNNFTIQINGFQLSHYERDLAGFIQRYDEIRRSTDSTWDLKANGLLNNIVQVKIPQVEQIKEALEDRRGYYEQLYDLMDLCFFEDGIDLFRYKNAQDFIKKCYGKADSSQYVAYKKQLTSLVDRFMESKRVTISSNEIELSILLVLSSPREKKEMLKMAKTGCFGHFIKVKDRSFYLKEPPIADMIIWDHKTKFTFLRVLVSWIITVGFFVGSYLLIAFATYKKQLLLSDNKFNVGCSMFYSSNQLESWKDALYAANQSIYMHCYCNYNYFLLNYLDTNMRNRCSKWFSDYFVYSGIPVLISLGIVIYNVIVDKVFRVLSKFEAHEYLSTELYSYIIKRSLMLVLNMGLIIILIKLDYKNAINIQDLSFLFQGTYNDLTSDWYMEIGVIIILTLAFNIVIPIADMIFVSFLKCIRKCVDRRCYCVRTSQKTKKGYLDLYLNDVFPIESRYSDFIAMIFITFAFSSVMPVLYVIAFLSIWFMFACDKLLLFRVYQKPINYSQDLQNKVYKFLYIAIMVHCVASFFILSQRYIINASTNHNVNIPRNDLVQIVRQAPFLIPYVAIFALMAAWAVFHTLFVKAISYCISKCSKEFGEIYRSKMNTNFYSSLNLYQLNRLKMSLEMQLHSNVEHQDINLNVIKTICLNSIEKLKEAEKQIHVKSKSNQPGHGQAHIKLIGRAGYDEMFDDETFNREKKIKSIDYQFDDIFRRERAMRANAEVERTLDSLIR